MINRIIDHIYISDVEDVLGGCPLREHEITHVLTVSAVDVPENQHVSNVKYHFVFVMDLPNFDILGGGQLSECVAYINDAVQCNGNVLIHCEAGVSRSVTVVSAYIMQKLKLTVEEAIDIVKKSRPLACPNSGFFRQLQIYEQLHYKTDEYLLSQCCMYKDWSISPGGSTLKGIYRGATVSIKEQNSEKHSKGNGSKFRCGNCRQILFFDEHLILHKRCDGKLCEFGYIVEPMKWMNVSDFKGKIFCHKCGTKLGNYLWSGRQCYGEIGARCKEYVTPWMHLHRSKIDEVKVHSPIERLEHGHIS